MDQFENFSTISCTKSKLKGGQFDEKNANSCILGPILWAILDTLGGGGLPISPELSDFEIYEQFPTQNPNSNWGPFYEKNCQLMYLRPHFGGHFEKWGVCQSALN